MEAAEPPATVPAGTSPERASDVTHDPVPEAPQAGSDARTDDGAPDADVDDGYVPI